ncbi:MAG: VWA domain-containing protein [Spirochaetia bacterium]|nr:VWA domain-containing protein [Spirochaetia bacterium]
MTHLLPDVLWAHPFWLWVLPAVLVYGAARVWLHRRAALPAALRQFHKAPARGRILSGLRLAVEITLLILMLTALAGPYRDDEVRSIKEEGIDIALVLDVSASMQAADFKPTRLEALKTIASDFVKRSSANRIAVYAFAGDVFTQTPLTSDHAVLLELLDALSYHIVDHSRSGGTAIGDALLTAGSRLVKNKIAGRSQVVMLITDGESNEGADPLLGARYLAENNIRLHVVGVGGDKEIQVFVDGKPFIGGNNQLLMTKLDDAQLKQIAKAADGSYYRASDENVLASIFDRLSRLERSPIEVETYRTRREYAALCALCAAPFLFLWAGIGFFVRRPLL